jgi:hypothetical protein
MNASSIENIPGSARQTTALAIRRRQHLTEESQGLSDLALTIAVQFTEHRTCFRLDCEYGFCTGCDDVIDAARWIDSEMDRAGVPHGCRSLPYPVRAPREEVEGHPV